MKNQKSLLMLMILPLLLAFSGCTKTGMVYVDRPMYIEDLNYTNDTNYTTTDYKLKVVDGNVLVPVDVMRAVLKRITYYREHAMIKDLVIESYHKLIEVNNKLSKEYRDE